jgi:hypothetical protein
MPVATQASLKGLTPEQLESAGCRLCLNNTYHLGLKPGQLILDKIGGAHKLQSWNHNILTGLFLPSLTLTKRQELTGFSDSGGSVTLYLSFLHVSDGFLNLICVWKIVSRWFPFSSLQQ